MCSCPLGAPVPNTKGSGAEDGIGSGEQEGAQKQGEEGCGREVAQAQLGDLKRDFLFSQLGGGQDRQPLCARRGLEK